MWATDSNRSGCVRFAERRVERENVVCALRSYHSIVRYYAMCVADAMGYMVRSCSFSFSFPFPYHFHFTPRQCSSLCRFESAATTYQ